jgi:hypothetical protein
VASPSKALEPRRGRRRPNQVLKPTLGLDPIK